MESCSPVQSIYDITKSPSNPTIFNNEIHGRLQEAARFAEIILDRRYSDVYGPQTNSSIHIGPTYNGFYSAAPVYSCGRTGRRGESGDDQKRAIRWLAGLAGAGVLTAASLFLGTAWREYNKNSTEASGTQALLGSTRRAYQESQYPCVHMSQFCKVLQAKGKILNFRADDAFARVCQSVAALAAGTMAVLGALLGSAPLMVAGTVIGLGTFCVYLVRMTMDETEENVRQLAREIIVDVEALERANPDEAGDRYSFRHDVS